MMGAVELPFVCAHLTLVGVPLSAGQDKRIMTDGPLVSSVEKGTTEVV